MECLKIINDTDIGSGAMPPEKYAERRAARAIVFDDERKVALIHVTNQGYHKLPGGGVEEGEDIKVALQRELHEEIGCAFDNIRELGIIEEYRNVGALHHISYCFVVDVVGDKGSPRLDPHEISLGCRPEWMSLEEAIRALEEEERLGQYDAKFIVTRDLTFLQAVFRLR